MVKHITLKSANGKEILFIESESVGDFSNEICKTIPCTNVMGDSDFIQPEAFRPGTLFRVRHEGKFLSFGWAFRPMHEILEFYQDLFGKDVSVDYWDTDMWETEG